MYPLRYIRFFVTMNEQKLTPKPPRPVKFYHGLIIFAIVLVSMVLLCAPLQWFFGVYGLAATEFLLFAIALLARRMMRWNADEVFPMALPPAREFFGSLFLFGGTYFGMTAVLTVTDYLFPTDLAQFADALSLYTADVSPIMALICMAFLPAVCEEALHRGILLYCFKAPGKKWLAILTVGIVFGFFHLDPTRFLSTGMMGAVFAYITLRTGSMILPMIFHFLTNMVSVYAMYAVPAEMTVTTVYSRPLAQVWGNSCALLAVMVVGWLMGLRMLDKKYKENAPWPLAVLMYALLIASAVLYFIDLYA